MAKTAIDKVYERFLPGDIVVDESYGSTHGVKVLKTVYVDEIDDYRAITQAGQVKNGVWKGDVNATKKEPVLYLYSSKELRDVYSYKWTPDPDIAKGDILKDQYGAYYLVESSLTVCALSKGTHASPSYWEKDGKVFTQAKSAVRDNFSKAARFN